MKKDIPAQDARRIEWFLQQRHEANLREGEVFRVSGYLSPTEVYTLVLLKNADESFYYPIECKVDPTEVGLPSPSEARDLLLDFQDYYIGRYLSEDREIFVPIDWAAVDFDETPIWVRGQIQNLKLERLADRWLAGERNFTEDEAAYLKLQTSPERRKDEG